MSLLFTVISIPLVGSNWTLLILLTTLFKWLNTHYTFSPLLFCTTTDCCSLLAPLQLIFILLRFSSQLWPFSSQWFLSPPLLLFLAWGFACLASCILPFSFSNNCVFTPGTIAYFNHAYWTPEYVVFTHFIHASNLRHLHVRSSDFSTLINKRMKGEASLMRCEFSSFLQVTCPIQNSIHTVYTSTVFKTKYC